MSTVLVVVAHPDDETFGTGSLIAAAVAEGADVVVCCATRGEAGEAADLPEGADLGEVREQELREAGGILGVSDFVLLGFGDSGMAGEAGKATLAGASFDVVVQAVTEVVERVRPDVVVTLDPDHGDGHRDHAVIGRATVEACRRSPGVRVYAWALSRPLMARWFAELALVRPESEHLDLDQAGLGRPDEDITTVLDIRPYRQLRERAIAAHATQVAPFEGMPQEVRDGFLDTDRLVRLQPPWTGGEPERSLF